MDNNSSNYNQDIWQQQPNPSFNPEPAKPNYDTPALVLGIVSAVTALIGICTICCLPVSVITGIISIIFVFITTKNGYAWNPTRIVALILSIISILGILLLFLFVILFMNSSAGELFMEEYMNIINEMANDPTFSGAYYN